MGRNRYKICNETAPYFITCTVLHWIPLFTRPATVQIILDCLAYRQQHRDFKIYAYVILENHLHLIVQSPCLSKEISSFKSYTARLLIDYLTDQKAHQLLTQFHFFRKKHKVDRLYQIWEEGYHPKEIQSDKMLIQKINYIHQNPVKRGYVDHAEHWRYSSARNYQGETGLLPVFMNWN